GRAAGDPAHRGCAGAVLRIQEPAGPKLAPIPAAAPDRYTVVRGRLRGKARPTSQVRAGPGEGGRGRCKKATCLNWRGRGRSCTRWRGNGGSCTSEASRATRSPRSTGGLPAG